jgi:peptidoglycan/xylan/chitin deacetylase (PgdA/CDA1 family)
MLTQEALPVLMYHHVSPNPGLVTVSPAAFRQQIEALATAGWRTPSSGELVAFYQGQPLPRKTVLITFDDGYLDNYIHAYPVLAEFGLNAIIFLVTSWIHDGPPRQSAECPSHRGCKQKIAAGQADEVILRWTEIELMQAAGTCEFHAHTHTHTRWDLQLAETEARCAAMQQELALCQETLSQRLGTGSEHLCWPQGYYQPEYIPIAQANGFKYLHTIQPALNCAGGDPLRIGRIVTKEKSGLWLRQRAALYAHPLLGHCYNWLKGNKA